MSDLNHLIDEIAELAPLPAAYVRVRELIQDPESDAADLARLIANDPALTARLLRLANSAYIGLISTIDTIPRAIHVLGMNAVHDLALASSAITAFDSCVDATFDIYRFWRRSIYCAIVAQLIAQDLKQGDPSRLFVSGLLHEVGHLILAAQRRTQQAALVEQALTSAKPLYLIEREHHGFDYAQLGAALLEHWLLPESIHIPVQYHVDPIANPMSEYTLATAIVHVASILSRGVVWRNERDDPVPEFNLIALTMTRVDAEQTDNLIQRADLLAADTMQMLMPRSPSRRAEPRSTA